LIQRNRDLSVSVRKSIVTKQGLRMFTFIYYLIGFNLLFSITINGDLSEFASKSIITKQGLWMITTFYII